MQEQFNFSINTPINPSENTLVIQVTPTHFRYGIYNPDEKTLLQLKHFSFKQIGAEKLDNIVSQNNILQENFYKIICGVDFGFNTLLPSEMDQADVTPIMYLENADQQDHVIRETIPGLDITNIYSVPPVILTWLVQHFPSAHYLHQHTAGISNADETQEQGVLKVDIQSNRFALTVYKDGQLLLAKTYSYTVPVDAVFYLLKICEQFQLSPQEVIVSLSGLVDTNSKLYREMYDYFLNISLKAVGWEDEISGLPPHYFTSLYELILCESLQDT